MLPTFDQKTGYLPPGTHQLKWKDVVRVFGSNSHRLRLIGGLLAACRSLSKAGCKELILDGSFVTAKLLPQDYDGVWNPDGVNADLLDPVLLDFTGDRAAMKAKYLGDLFPANMTEVSGVCFEEFFRNGRNGIEKGLVQMKLGCFS